MNDLTLTDRCLIIRPAREDDVDQIWSLLHANCRAWPAQQIMQHLDGFVVLAKNRKILGVLYGSLNPENMRIDWVEVHPYYPEKPLRELIIRGLNGAWYDRPKPATRVVQQRLGSVRALKGGKHHAPMAGRDSAF